MTRSKINNFEDRTRAIFQVVSIAYKAQPLIFIFLVIMQFIQSISPVVMAWIAKLIFDELSTIIQSNNQSFNKLIPLFILQVVVNVLQFGTQQLDRFLNSELSRRITLKAQILTYEQIGKFQGLKYFEMPEFYNKITIATGGIREQPTQILLIFTNIVRGVISLISFLGIILVLDNLLLLVLFVSATAQSYYQLKFSKSRFNVAVRINPLERISAYYESLLSGIYFAKELRLFGTINYFIGLLQNNTHQIHNEQRRQEIQELSRQIILGVFTTLILSFSIITVFYRAFLGQITIGSVILYNSALQGVQLAISQIISSIAMLNISIFYFLEFQNLKQMETDLPTSASTKSVPKLMKGIEIKNLSFRYNDHTPYIFQNLNLFIPAGKVMAIVGLNGAGKTTLTKLIMRFYDPLEGQILWDDIDIRNFDIQEFRLHLGAVFQDFVHYDLTAQQNIGLGNITHINDMVLIKEAAKKAQIDAVIEKLPLKYKTYLSRSFGIEGEGSELSGGEWQKVAIARMLTRGADLVFLDEPTSALDAQAEHEIFTQIANLATESTTVLISHRFSTVRIADCIIVIDNGVIIEQGSHSELIENKNLYYDLYMSQAAQYKE